MFDPTSIEERSRVELIIAFIDLSGFAAQCARVDDDEVAGTLDELYTLVGSQVGAAGGHVVKVMGDGAMVVFDPADTDRAVEALLGLKLSVDAFLAGRNWSCRMSIRIHAGPVVAGRFGVAGDKRFDVVGRHVNAAAMLASTGLTLSAEAFRSVSPALRRRFKKHTWPAVYTRVEDPSR